MSARLTASNHIYTPPTLSRIPAAKTSILNSQTWFTASWAPGLPPRLHTVHGNCTPPGAQAQHWVGLRLSSHSPHPICLQNLLPLLGNKPRVQSLLTASTRTLRHQASVVSTLAYCSGSRRRPFVSCLFQCSSSQLGEILASGQGHVFGFHNWGKGCYRHLVSGGQKCCWRSSNGQDRPLQQRTVWIKRSVALRLKIFALPVLNTIAQGDPTKTDIKSCHVPAQ